MLASSSTWLVFSRTICYGQPCCSSWRPRKTSTQKCRTRYQTKLTTNSRIFTLEPNIRFNGRIHCKQFVVKLSLTLVFVRPTSGRHNHTLVRRVHVHVVDGNHIDVRGWYHQLKNWKCGNFRKTVISLLKAPKMRSCHVAHRDNVSCRSRMLARSEKVCKARE